MISCVALQAAVTSICPLGHFLQESLSLSLPVCVLLLVYLSVYSPCLCSVLIGIGQFSQFMFIIVLLEDSHWPTSVL